VTIFYRGPQVARPTAIPSNPDFAEIVARLGGEGPISAPGLNFSYGDIVAIVQALADSQQLCAYATDGRRQQVAFMLQQAPKMEQQITGAPIIPDQRPQGNGGRTDVTPVSPAHLNADKHADLARDGRPN
jgi:hypothetical protein